MAVIGTALFQMWAEASGSGVESLSFSMENLPRLDAIGVISMNTVAPQLDPRSTSGPPEAAAFLMQWFTADGGVGEADPVFWGAFSSPKLLRVDFGVTCIQMKAKWTLAVDLYE